jgi:hypothetical protein
MLQYYYHYCDQIREYEVDMHIVHMDEMRNTYKIIVRKPEGKRLLGDMDRWEGTIKMDRKEIG